jgi:hypothetical protein
MRSRRYRRILSLVASLLWLVTGVTDAAGFAVCTYHGHSEYGASHGGHGGSESPRASAPAHGSHAAHAAHSPSSDADGLAQTEAPGDALACALDEAAGDHGCDCRFMCSLGVGNDAPPQPSVSTVADSPPDTPEPPLPASVGTQLSFHLVPFLLPPSIAPPIS